MYSTEFRMKMYELSAIWQTLTLNLCFIPSRVASLEVVKSTAFFSPAQIINRTKSIKINILIGLTLINMVIKTNQISYST